ncbi:MAG TPA: hypothetical protein VFM98_21540 [Ramlibacter sp.]|uniref:hypothetical protein n=1 Tax=Ramlibacter sp. TaxID=1917967 RepID=UPI002D7FB774|nr:hypothetical protein [Ramlibacter sp.]HET8748196.1 hypothetical protein [Ramlibacter sp.]
MQPARWKLTLIACAAASCAAQAQMTAPSDAGQLPASAQPAATQPAEAPPPETEEPAARAWRLPPMRVSGTLAYDMRAVRSGGEPSSIANVLTGTIGTTTYLYAPWLALVNGSLGLSTSVTHSGAGALGAPFDDSGPHERLRTRENFITGDGRLDLFPRSRFPAEIHFSRQDSRTDTGLATPIQFQRQNIGMSARYRPESGLYNLAGAYDHRTQSGFGFRSKQDSLSADFNTHWKANELALGGAFNRAVTEALDDDSRFSSLVARHTYSPSNALSVNSTANLTRTEQRGFGDADLQVLQLASVGLYHPERSPLTLTGSVRGLVLRDQTFDAQTDSVSGTVGANYEVNSNLRVTANGGLTTTHSGNGQSTFFAGALGANYQGDSLEYRGIRYDWFASGTVGTSVADSGVAGSTHEQSLGLQVGHSANRSWALSPRSSLGLSASQSLSAAFINGNEDQGSGFGLGDVKTLLNSVALTWQQSGEGKTGFARASYSDSMELGGGDARFQLFNFQVSGNFELGYGRSLTADLTYQRTHQRAGDLPGLRDPITGAVLRTRTSGVSGEIAFHQNQLFGVRRLQFVSRVRLAQDVLRQPGQLLSIPDRETRLWENRLDWSIGRLTTQVELRMSQIDGRRVDSLWLRVQRNFGD